MSIFNIIDTTENLEFDPINYVSKPRPPKPPEPEIVLNPEVEKIRETIKYMETRGEANPYSFSQPSGKQKLGNALGAYQITEAKLKENSKRFLNKDVTKDEFLNNPGLQDAFIRKEIEFLQSKNFRTNSLFAAHRGGWSDLSRNATIDRNTQYERYVKEAMGYYNDLVEEELMEAEKEQTKKSTKKETKQKPIVVNLAEDSGKKKGKVGFVGKTKLALENLITRLIQEEIT